MNHNSVTTHEFQPVESGFDPLDNIDTTQLPYTPAAIAYYERFNCDCGATEYRTYTYDADAFDACCRPFDPTSHASLSEYTATRGGLGTVSVTFVCAHCGESHEHTNPRLQRTITESYGDE